MNPDEEGSRRDLRLAAEARLPTLPQSKTRSTEDLLLELQVHQIELEMQNEALRQAQLALSDSRDRYVDLYEFAPTGYLTLTSEGIVAELNLTAATLLGKERKLLLHRSFRTLVAAEDRDRWVRYFLKAIKNDESSVMELNFLRGDGTQFTAQLHCVRQHPTLRISLTDITERKQIENSLRESEQAFRMTFNQAAVGIARVGTDGTWLEVNQKLCDIVGYSKDELLKLTFHDITHPDDLNADMIYVQQMLAGEIESYAMEQRYVHKSGKTVWINLTVSLARSSDGSPKYFISVVEDIDARRQSETRLFKLSLAVEQSPNSIVITDTDARIEYVNATFIRETGYSLEEVIGNNPRILQSGKTPRATYEDMWAHLLRGELWKGEFTNRRKDGTEYNELVHVSPVRQANGQTTSYLAIKENITERKVSDARIERLAHFDQLTGLPRLSP